MRITVETVNSVAPCVLAEAMRRECASPGCLPHNRFAAALLAAVKFCDFDEVYATAYPESARDLTRVLRAAALAYVEAGGELSVEP